MTLAERPQLQGQFPAPEGEDPIARPSPALQRRQGWQSSILRQAGIPTGGTDSPQKREGDMADLLIMSMLDQKAPPKAAGTGDLLDTLVEDHLSRAQPRGPAITPQGEASPRTSWV